MGLHLHVAPHLKVLAEALAAELSHPLSDPFTTEVLAVPGDGVRSWLMDELSGVLGSSSTSSRVTGSGGVEVDAGQQYPSGIAANIDVVFPATVVARALAGDRELREVMSSWSVGSLTWALHEVLQAEDHGIPGGLQRARSLADLFDRYAMHRVEMVRAWESGRDVDAVGRTLPDALMWQPQLWRSLVTRLGPLSGPAAMALATQRLRLGRITADLPSRVFIFGLASIPIPHLRVLLALSTQIQVEVFVPTWSRHVWQQVRQVAVGQRLAWPIERVADPTAHITRHPLGGTWGRTAREAQLVVAAVVADESGVTITESDADPVASPSPTLLCQIKADLRSDTAPPGVIALSAETPTRMTFDPADQSLTWHTCHGPGRQAEVVRDVVRGLLEERDPQGLPLYEPRDIAILCADPAVSTPLISAAFSTDSIGSHSSIPIRIADRSLREESSLFTTISSMLDLLEGRFRASDLLSFAALEPVRARYGWDLVDLGRIATWVEETGIRWGLEERHQTAFGLPPGLGVHTWRAGLDQLVVGAVMGDRSLVGEHVSFPQTSGEDSEGEASEGEVGESVLSDLAHPGIEGDVAILVGSLAEMVQHLAAMDEACSTVSTAADWCQMLTSSVRQMCVVSEDEAWQWRRFDDQINGLLAEAQVAGEHPIAPVTAVEMAELFRARLQGSAGRVRFGTGAVTVSSLTAQRGVPHQIVVIFGLDGDLGAGSGRAEDLIAAQPCLGDRDPRSELRAQLLDAVMAASQRLIIVSTGRNITSNEEVPPAVPLAELADLIDATAMGPDASSPPVSEMIVVQHPRHGWGSRNFVSGAMIPHSPWGFQLADLEAARERRERQGDIGSHDRWQVLPPHPTETPTPLVLLSDLERTLRNPLETYLAGRLGVVLPRSADQMDDLIPLRGSHLKAWQLRQALLEERLRVGSRWSVADAQRWSRVQRRRGLVPPLSFGTAAIEEASRSVDLLIQEAFGDRIEDLDLQREQRALSLKLETTEIQGVITNLRGSRLLEIRPGLVRAEHLLQGWLRLMLLTCAEPQTQWQLTIVGLDTSAKSGPKPASVTMSPRDHESALAALQTVLELHMIASQTPVIAPAGTTMALATGGPEAGRTAWEGYASSSSDSQDRWVRFAYGRIDFADLLEITPNKFESGPQWSEAGSQVQRWADLMWTTVAQSLVPPPSLDPEEAGGIKESWLMRLIRKIWPTAAGVWDYSSQEGGEQ